MTRTAHCLLLMAATLGPLGTGAAIAQDAPNPPQPGIAELHRLDLLPRFKEGVKVASFSSHDRTGGNDDGFSGTHSFLRKEDGGLVIAEMEGPGVIYRIWTPTPTDDLVEFYFDGEQEPRLSLPFRDLFTGDQSPFLKPIVGAGAGGFYCYLPLPYEESCKVVFKGDRLQFYQLNYATYPEDAEIETFDPNLAQEYKAHLEKARTLFASSGEDVSEFAVADDADLATHAFREILEPGKAITIFETGQAGRIAGLTLGSAQAFAGNERDVLINFYWDGDEEPSISVPVGDFFGYSYGEPAVESIVLGTSDDTNYIYLPMPFDESARIELVSENPDGQAISVNGQVKHSDRGRSDDEGKLYAVWRRENPTTQGQPYTFIDTQGKGHVVGLIQQAQGLEPGMIPIYFEGDDQTTIDGELVIHGTGSEDLYNGGWYDVPGRWEDRVSLPLSGSLEYNRHLGRTGGYRFMITDAYHFEESILQTIEHGPEGNKVPTDYTSVTYLYAAEAPQGAGEVPDREERRVRVPDRAVFNVGVTTPIHSFSRGGATLAKKRAEVGGENVQHLSLTPHVQEPGDGQFIAFILDVPAAGDYRVLAETLQGPNQGIIQIFENDQPHGERVDLYAPEQKKSEPLDLGTVTMKEGENRLFIKIVGKNEESEGFGFDLVRIICAKVEE